MNLHRIHSISIYTWYQKVNGSRISQVAQWMGKRVSSTNGKDLSSKTFWNHFYTRPHNKKFEWFLGFEDLKDYLKEALVVCSNTNDNNSFPKILEIGCGTSNISFELFNHLKGRCTIDCVDYSEKAVKIMKSRLEELKKGNNVTNSGICGMMFQVAEARFLPFNDKHFDLSIDKGTSDAILRAQSGEVEFIKTVTENLRVLRSGGILLQFSDEGPELRMDLLQKVIDNIGTGRNHQPGTFRVHYKELGCYQGMDYFMYTINNKNEKS